MEQNPILDSLISFMSTQPVSEIRKVYELLRCAKYYLQKLPSDEETKIIIFNFKKILIQFIDFMEWFESKGE